MKVNQIVSEHKKGVRAKKYTTKAKGTVPVYGPDSKDAKLKPVKPVGTLNEIESVATAVKQNPDGSTVYKDATGAEKTAAAGEIKTGPDGKPTLAVAGITPGEQINITDKVAEACDTTEQAQVQTSSAVTYKRQPILMELKARIARPRSQARFSRMWARTSDRVGSISWRCGGISRNIDRRVEPLSR